jgi:hypothetical protein
MQTFLPYADFEQCAKVLDYRRLGKQRTECKQIMLALTTPNYGWQNHPAVLMWRGYEASLARYGAIMCQEWISRGYKDTTLPFFQDRPQSDIVPDWITEALCLSHRSNLLRKNLPFYGQVFGSIPCDLEYVWPTRHTLPLEEIGL